MHFRGTTSIRQILHTGALLPRRSGEYPGDLGYRDNGLTRAGLLSFEIDFFGRQSGRHSTQGYCGGFQPAATPSLAARHTLTPPGRGNIRL